jgi:hypothetical protein
MKHYFVIDVESIGLHGEAYAVAGAVFDESGAEKKSFCLAVDDDKAQGSDSDRAWVIENIPGILITHQSLEGMRRQFWRIWETVKVEYPGIQMAGECVWPVETGFLSACVKDDVAAYAFHGPYPLMEISSVMQAAGMDPMATYDRWPDELPKHNPLADVRQSARLLFEALARIQSI